MIRQFVVLCLLAPALAMADCPEDVEFVAQLIAKDPVALAQLATARGDFQLLGIAGVPVRVPGVDTARCTARSERVRVIAGTGNVSCSPDAAKLQASVFEFARRYNQVMKSLLDARDVRYALCR